ncbi:MAG TPA: lipase secretion chaperone [Tahibacter sp.]|uniref:lipase secretion chaperone n=1 Tax=Tahibacter sp. TaxID=2056211 RepID=UPI002B794586|nr:lipase secretion chaperone [Tahibacter sp.]HSX60316.1 lipase secretion chaperone [Tahibacter sp.]
MKIRAVVAAAALTALLLAAFAWRRDEPPATVAAAAIPTRAAEVATRDPVASTAAQRTPQTATAAREDSLRGTAVDGTVRVDAQGRVVRDRGLRRVFDYFLTRLGERSPERIRDDFAAWLQQQPQLDAAARAEALALFDRYVELQRAAAALPRSNDLRADLQRLQELRVRELGAELARAWFGDEEAYAAQTLARLEAARDASLDAATRERRLAEIDAQLDPAQRASRDDSTAFQQAVSDSAGFDADAASAQRRAEQRRQRWGEDAAVRLAELDQQEASWQLRLRAYAQAREQLFADRGLAPAQRELRLARLLEDFSEPERRRVLALAEEGRLPR